MCHSLCVAVVLTLVAAVQASAQAGDPKRLLYIDAVAYDRDGLPVSDLAPADFEVWIGGYRVPVETFDRITSETERGARLVVLLLDDVTLHPVHMTRVRETARRFVERMSPGDKMAVLSLNGAMMESTDDRTRLLAAIGDYQPRATGVMRFDTLGEHALTTLTSIARRVPEVAPGRVTIVGIGSGWLFDTPIPPPVATRDLRPEWTTAMQAMALANANFYVIDPGGVGTAPVTGGSGGFARETGGHAFINTNDPKAAADQIMREAGTYYLIGVADPPIQRKADLRELDVRARRSGVTIRARRNIAGTEAR